MPSLSHIVHTLLAPGKGILAADESTTNITKHFTDIGVESTEENRRAYREILFTTPDISQYMSGVIMYDETIRQTTHDGKKFVDVLTEQGIVPGIKVDLGLDSFNDSPIEKMTKGLEGLSDRLREYYMLGARFAKWRAVFSISDSLPSDECIALNADLLAQYALHCLTENIIPIVEPEVLMDGAHTIERCYEVTSRVQIAVFGALQKHGVDLNHILLKPNMIFPGSDFEGQVSVAQVAELTVRCLLNTVPASVPGVVFLSGGQSEEMACETLQAIIERSSHAPWHITYSYGRALQHSALRAWSGMPANITAAQKAFAHQAQLVSLAQQGKYSKNKGQ